MRRWSIISLVFTCLPACGDDGSVASDETTSGTSSGGPTTSTTEPGTSTSTPTGDTGSGSGSEESTDGGESTSGSGSSSTGAVQLCGNGVTDDGETCDDGNIDDDDSCTADCTTATCLVPVTHATVQAGAEDADCPTVWILPGTYVENLSVNRDVVFEHVLNDPVILEGNGGRTIDIGGGNITLRGLTVTDGSATFGGGIRVDFAALTLDGTTVDDNIATVAGGGVYVEDGTLSLVGGSAVTNNIASAEDVESAAAEGGGIAARASVVTIADSTLRDNTVTADLSSGDGLGGDALAAGGGLWANGSQVFVTGGSVVTGNAAFVACLPADPASSDFCLAEGGGLHVSDGPLLVSDSAIDGNTAHGEMTRGSAFGGALYVEDDAVVSLLRSSISMNVAEVEEFGIQANAAGGAVVVLGSGPVSLQLTETTGNGNSTASIGIANSRGGFYAGGPNELSLLIERSTFEGNTADAGGGFARLGGTNHSYAIVNSTFSGNSAPSGGAIEYFSVVGGTLEIDSCTFTLNAASSGGGAVRTIFSDNTLEVRNSILYGNTAPTGPDCLTSDGTLLNSGGYNVFGSESGCQISGDISGNQIGVDPELGALMDNGGPTFTHALSATSPATNAGNPSACVGAGGFFLTTDQRGELRHADNRCDVGAYEYQP